MQETRFGYPVKLQNTHLKIRKNKGAGAKAEYVLLLHQPPNCSCIVGAASCVAEAFYSAQRLQAFQCVRGEDCLHMLSKVRFHSRIELTALSVL